jgi:hypothetical protein
MKPLPLLFLVLTPFLSSGQSKKIASVKTTSEIIYAAIDRAGDFYIVLQSGEILKYDKNGISLGNYVHEGTPTLFDPANAIRLLVYYKKTQEFTWLSPDLGINPFQTIDSSIAIDVALICPAGDQNIWVLDDADLGLKKVSLKDSRVLTEFSISDQFKENGFTLMREYQNFLFLLDPKTGITVYNSFGKQIRKIQETGISYFNFLGEELYYKKDNQLKFLDLFTTETRELAIPTPSEFVLLTDERMILVNKNQVNIFDFIP